MVKLTMDANNYFDYDDGDDRDINEDDDLEQDPNFLQRLDICSAGLQQALLGAGDRTLTKITKLAEKTIFF